MNVNSNGIAIVAQGMLSIYEIISIIMDADDLQSKVRRSIYHWTRKVIDDLDVQSLDERLLSQYILVRNKGPNTEAIRERMRMRILCECGCTITRNKISNHTKTMKQKPMLEEALRKKRLYESLKKKSRI